MMSDAGRRPNSFTLRVPKLSWSQGLEVTENQVAKAMHHAVVRITWARTVSSMVRLSFLP
jgi:hypothetical protein